MTEFAHAAEGHRRELLLHCYRMLGSLPDAEDAVQETMLRAWRYRDSLKEGAPLRPWLYRVATNACLDAIARDERRAVLAAKVAADDGAAGKLDDVVWLRPIPDSQLEPPTPPLSTPEAITLTRETPVRVADLLAEGERMPVYVHVIDHPDARVLVDTGMTELHPAAADLDPRLLPLNTLGELDEPRTEGQLRVRALDPELVWLAHEHEPWRPRFPSGESRDQAGT